MTEEKVFKKLCRHADVVFRLMKHRRYGIKSCRPAEEPLFLEQEMRCAYIDYQTKRYEKLAWTFPVKPV